MSRRDPGRLIDALTAYWQTEALTAAIDLGLFTTLGRRALTARELARLCQADRLRLARLCNVLVSQGWLRERRGRYRATADAAAFLDARSPEALLGAREFFAGPTMVASFRSLAATLRRRTRSGPAASDRTWIDFADSMSAMRGRLALDIASELRARRLVRGRLLDVGAGASPLGIELLRRNPAASLVVLDRGPVVALAKRRAVAAGVGARVEAIAGRAESAPWGGPYDVILMINVLEYFDDRDRQALVRKAHAALRPGGSLVVHAPLLNGRGTAPPEAIAYDLMLLALGARGGAATFKALEALCRGAGFSSVTRARRRPLVVARR